MEEKKTHFRKLFNPDYLGAYALEPNKDLILTIKEIKIETITNCDSKKEQAPVIRFEEKNIKPMILNSTNSKTINKLYKTPYIENWVGRKIQLYADNIKAFGEWVEALRIRPFVPKIDKIDTTCNDCKQKIKQFENSTPEKIAAYTYKKYGKALCTECATKEKELIEADEVKDVLSDKEDV